jgi:hypothetical protein
MKGAELFIHGGFSVLLEVRVRRQWLKGYKRLSTCGDKMLSS